MNDLLLSSIIVSVVINLFLFIYLYKKKRKIPIKDGFIESSLDDGIEFFSQTIKTEINRVERYEDYSFCLVILTLEHAPSNLKSSLQTFIRKSDSVYIFNNTIYIIFPFLHVDDSFKDKINKKLVEYIESSYNNIELLNVDIQECNIHEMISVDQLLKDAK